MIDAHHHLWKYHAEEFEWVTDEMALLRNDFLPANLEIALSNTGVTGCITVQATQTLEETEWLLSLAAQHPVIKGVVGWVPLKSPSVGSILDRLSKDPYFRGVREILQGATDEQYFDSQEFHRGLRELTLRAIPYDLLIFQNQILRATSFVDDHPEQLFILDHCAKPEIGISFSEAWGEGIKELSRRQNVLCKFSGLVTEVRCDAWNVELLRPYFKTILEAFGAKRVMFGSDWPVCLLKSDYGRWVAAVKELTAELSESEKEAIFSGTVKRAYSVEE